MKIGTIGAGEVALGFAQYLLQHGHEVYLSNSRGPESLTEIVASLGEGAHAATVEDAASLPIVLLAVHWRKVPAALNCLPAWNGRILIDATNHFDLPSHDRVDLGGHISSELVAELSPGARVVKALNNLPTETFVDGPTAGGGRRVIFVSGDDADAKKVVSGLFTSFGFATIDLGSLHEGGRAQQLDNGLVGPDLVVLSRR